MDLDEVQKLLELMESHGLDEVEIEQGDTRIKLRKGGSSPMPIPTVIAAPLHVAAANGLPEAAAPQNGAEAAKEEKDDAGKIASPMVGTFYRSPTPDADSFVHVGDHVTADQVVCIIEAMKVMNEIKAEAEGEILSILVESGESVEYGQPLMTIRHSTPSD
jgi:acetyl-CoA carboxylase biotin carboxyl carrier protein